MAYTNALNVVWNEAHGGARVPINDTGLPGAPSALPSNLAEWTQGSINKAVYDAYVLYNEFDVIDKPDAEGGTLDLLRCTYFVNRDMLWGFSGDARYKRPGDAMSFRGYPTSIVAAHIITTELAYSPNLWTADGAITNTQGLYSIFSTNVQLQYKVPYNFQYEVQFKIGFVTLYYYDVLIEAGNTLPTHYKLQSSEDWLPLTQGKLFLSANMQGYTGDREFTVLSGNVVQEPFYGTLDNLLVTLTEDEYNPALTATYSIGSAFRVGNIVDIMCYVENCNEIEDKKLFQTNAAIPTHLFITSGESFALGASVWKDAAGTLPVDTGTYLWTEFAYFYEEGEETGKTAVMYTIRQYVHVDTVGKISQIYLNITGTFGCGESSFCS